MDKVADQYMTDLDTELLSAIVICLEDVLNTSILGDALFDLECELDEYVPYCAVMNKAVLPKQKRFKSVILSRDKQLSAFTKLHNKPAGRWLRVKDWVRRLWG